jgi:two-component sensor histidine kinase
VWLSLRSEPESQYTLIVRDHGVGLPEDFSLERADTLGLQLVSMLSVQLRGRVVYRNCNPGAEFKLDFKGRT